jgi:hypothetical protein
VAAEDCLARIHVEVAHRHEALVLPQSIDGRHVHLGGKIAQRPSGRSANKLRSATVMGGQHRRRFSRSRTFFRGGDDASRGVQRRGQVRGDTSVQFRLVLFGAVSMGGCIASAVTGGSAVEVMGAVPGTLGGGARRALGVLATRCVAAPDGPQTGKRGPSVRAFVLQTGGCSSKPPSWSWSRGCGRWWRPS